jgi:hypothetical protein
MTDFIDQMPEEELRLAFRDTRFRMNTAHIALSQMLIYFEALEAGEPEPFPCGYAIETIKRELDLAGSNKGVAE